MMLFVRRVVSNMLIVGYTTRSHLLLDLDETSLYDVERLAKLIIKNYPDVGDCLIVESSTPSFTSYLKHDAHGVPHERWTYQNFHLVFNATIRYERCLAIIDDLVDLDVLAPEYKQIRLFRGDMTLRVSEKVLHHRIIPSPRPLKMVRHRTRHDYSQNIARYLTLLMMCRTVTTRLFYEATEKSM